MTKKARKIDLIAAEIMSCRDRNGRISPKTVWQKAKANPKGVLYSEFEWNLQRAAEQHWEDRARELIRMARSVVQLEDRTVLVPRFISDATDDNASYVETSVVAKSKTSVRLETLRAELGRIQAAIHRASALAAVFGLEDKFEAMLREAIEAERLLLEVA